MTRDDILRMAREAGLDPLRADTICGAATAIERFAALVATAEREACAQVAINTDRTWRSQYGDRLVEGVAARIRARGVA